MVAKRRSQAMWTPRGKAGIRLPPWLQKLASRIFKRKSEHRIMCGGLSTVSRRRNPPHPKCLQLLPNLPTAGDQTIVQCNPSPMGESFILFFISADVTEEIDLSHIAEKGLRNTVSDLIHEVLPE
ncbi:hypothetical protein NPIL_653601 [Nephila pilipes]|uniref:Uncharacterized protein n=1 Tax=Nephila pilipes TaxID=299642 RepID=A0A8X6UPV2_NEPPI|nr:hypothetical protein NPIL_653601 [Nephila pilipes]